MSEENDVRQNNIKIAVTAVFSVLLGAAFILALIHFGMRVQNNIDTKAEEKRKADEVITINSVDFQATNFGYKIPKNDTDEGSKNYLVKLINKESDLDYVVINSNSVFEDVMNAIRAASGNENISYNVSDGFFNSGTIIAVTREANCLESFDVKTVTRDADYNLQIDADYKQCEGGDKSGYVSLVKISNIQPKGVEIKANRED